MIDFDFLQKTPSARILIAPTVLTRASRVSNVEISGGVRAFITSDLTISAASRYNSPLESQKQNSMSETVAGIGAIAQRVIPWAELREKISGFTLRSVGQSVATYSATEKPTFNVSLLFVATRSDDDVRKKVAALYDMVMPSFAGFGFDDLVRAPLNYAPGDNKGATGTIAVQVGSWFQALDQIMTNVTFTFSKESIPNGSPLYAHGSISFEPYRVISAEELRGYMLLGKGS